MTDVSANAFAAETPNMQRNAGGKRKRGPETDSNTPSTRRTRGGATGFQQQPQQDVSQDTNGLYLGEQLDLSALQGGSENNSLPASNAGPHAHDGSPSNPGEVPPNPYQHMTVAPPPGEQYQQPPPGPNNGHAEFHDEAAAAAAGAQGSPSAARSTPNKPQVGSDEWHKVRKDNHKEVERRRRETINEGINELAKIVPGCEKNKGSILQRAVQYIQRLQDDATSNIDKWTFEKMITEQAITDVSAKCHRAYAERDAWRRLAAEAGVDVDRVDLGIDEVALEKEIEAGQFAIAEKENKRLNAEREKIAQEGRTAQLELEHASEVQT